MDYSTLFNAIVDAVVVIDKRGTIIDVNPGCQRMFGYRSPDLVGRNVSILMPANLAHEHDDYIQRYLTSGEPKIIGRGRESVAVRADGQEMPIRLTVAEAVYNGEPQFVGILQDLTKQAEAEQRANEAFLKLQQLDRAMTVAELGSALAHELNQPLTALTLYLTAAKKYVDDHQSSEALSGVFEKAAAEGHRAASIIKRIRSMIEDRDIETSVQDLGPIVAEAVRFMRTALKDQAMVLDWTPPSTPICVKIDPIQLNQVLANLIKNAAEATGASGQVQISLNLRQVSFVQLVVEDNGPGFAPSVLENLFASFQTTKAQGLGIGMSLSKRIIEQMDGVIQADNASALGGARVTIEFALADG